MPPPTPPAPQEGDAVRELVREPTGAQLLQFSAVTWNTHRIHYDVEHAREEGYPGVLVQSHLHACFLAQAVQGTWGPTARLERLGWQNRGLAVPGDRLTVTGQVTRAERAGAGVRAELTLEERNQRGELCAKGWATIVVPDEEDTDGRP